MEFNAWLVEDLKDLHLAEYDRKIFLRHLKDMAGISDADIETMEEFEELIQMMEM